MAETRVLLIDDDVDARKGIARYLRTQAGFRVVEYAEGVAALQHLATTWQAYTAVLLDYVLRPPPSGERVLEQIRARYSHLPVIVFTGRDPIGGLQALAKGAYRYMRRPLDLAEVVGVIRNLAEQDMVFYQMARDVRTMLGSDMCLAWRLNRQRRQLYVAAWDGEPDLDQEYREQVFLDLDDPATNKLMEEGKPIYLSDVTNPKAAPHYRHRKEARKRGWTSLISIPLVHQRLIVGLIDGYTSGRCKLSPEEREQLKAVTLPVFARQAVEAVRNADLSSQFQVLQGLNQVLAGAIDEEAVIRQILSKSLELVGGEGGWLYLIDAHSGKLALRDSLGVPAGLLKLERDLGNGITGWVAKEGRAADVSDASKDERHQPIAGIEITSEVAVPLRREEQTIGVLAVISQFRNAFTEDDLNLLISLATQAAIAIERGRLSRHLQAVSRLTLENNYQALADYVVEAARDLTGTDVLLWGLSEHAEEQGQFLRVVAAAGDFDREYVQTSTLPISPGASITALALQERMPNVRKDILEDRQEPKFHYLEEAKERGWHSFMTVPLFARKGEFQGALNLHSKQISTFGQAAVGLMATFVNQVQAALENVRLLEEARARQVSLEKMVHIGDLVVRETAAGLKPVLEKAAQGAYNLFGADCIAVYPYDADRQTFYDLDQVAFYGLQRPRRLKFKPHLQGMAAVIRNLGELVVHDVDKGDLGPVDAPRISQPGLSLEHLPEFIREHKFVRDERIKAFVGLSLMAGSSRDGTEQEVGVLYIGFRQPHYFTAEELDFIRVFAHQVGSATQNARLLDVERNLRRQAEALREVSATISSALTLEDIGGKMLEELGRMVEYRKASMQLIRGDSRNMLAYRGFGSEGIDPYLLRPLPEDALAGRVVTSKEPVILSDTSSEIARDSGWEVHRTTQDVKSWVGVPLVYAGETVGLVTLDHDAAGFYTETLKGLLTSFGNQAATGIAKARLVERQIRDLAIVNDVLRMMNTKLNSEGLLRAIVSQVRENLRCTHCTFFLAQKQQGQVWLVPKETDGVRREQIMKRRFRPGEGLAGWVFEHRESVVSVDARRDPRFALAREAQDRPRSMLVAPVRVGDQIIGVISADQDEFGWFSESDKRVLEALAQQAGIAIQRAAGVDLLRTIGDQINRGGQRAEDILRAVVSGAIKLTHTDAGIVDVLDEGGKSVVDSYKYPLEFQHDGPVDNEQSLTREIITGGKTEAITDIRGDPRVNSRLRDKFRSLIGVPLKLKANVVGILYLIDKQPHHFSEIEVALLETLADQAVGAIENARLYQKLEEAQEQRMWAEIGKTAGSLAHRIGNKGGIVRACVRDLAVRLGDMKVSDDVLDENLRMIKDNSDYLLQLSDLLFRPVEAARAGLNRTDISLMISDGIRAASIPREVAVEIEASVNELPQVPANRFFVEAFVELINNAVVAMQTSQQKRLTFAGRAVGDHIEILISDTGAGIAASERAVLFDLFTRTSDERLRARGHRGFGLWWVKSFLVSMGGDIVLADREKDGGSTLIVRIPLKDWQR